MNIKSTRDIHRYFATYFNAGELEPYIYILSKKMSEGHICINIENTKHADFGEYYPGTVTQPKHLHLHHLVSDGTQNKPFVINNGNLYMQRYYKYESNIISSIQSIISYENEVLEKRMQDLTANKYIIKQLFPELLASRTDWQMLATLSAIINQFSIITGGPGTGKTTTVSRILTMLLTLTPDMHIALAAPTGKAANRMAESLKRVQYNNPVIREKINNLVPSTIHRLLGSQKNSIYFKHDTGRPLPYDLVIIDESSMIDIALFSKLLSAIQPSTKVILLGDKDQLASVEAGSIFGDLCNAEAYINIFSTQRARWFGQFTQMPLPVSEHINNTIILFEHVIALQYSHRFSTEKGIGQLSNAIISSNKDAIQSFFNNEDDEVFIDETYSEDIFNRFLDGYLDYIQETDINTAFNKLNRLKVLCALREGNEGIVSTNARIEKYLQSRKWIHRNTEFYENRPVIITKNNYELGLFNGDTGIVKRDEHGNLKVWFESSEGSLISFQPSSIEAAETVYAMTIHKSQGSELDNIMIVLPKNEDTALLTRELLYTAVTRARNRVIIQGSHNVILESAEKKVERGSGLAGRMRNSID